MQLLIQDVDSGAWSLAGACGRGNLNLLLPCLLCRKGRAGRDLIYDGDYTCDYSNNYTGDYDGEDNEDRWWGLILMELFRITIMEASANWEVRLLTNSSFLFKTDFCHKITVLAKIPHVAFNIYLLFSDKSSLMRQTESLCNHRWTFVEAFWFQIAS